MALSTLDVTQIARWHHSLTNLICQALWPVVLPWPGVHSNTACENRDFIRNTETHLSSKQSVRLKDNTFYCIHTWSPASKGGYCRKVSAFLKCSSGISNSSDWMWPKKVEDILQRDFPAALLAAIARIVADEITTSWKPATTCPPVKYSNCLPAYYLHENEDY